MKTKIILGFVAFFILGVFVGAWTQPQHAIRKMFSPTMCPIDGARPDKHGCCTDEIYTDMGELGYNCCPAAGGDCFPPIK